MKLVRKATPGMPRLMRVTSDRVWVAVMPRAMVRSMSWAMCCRGMSTYGTTRFARAQTSMSRSLHRRG